MGGERGSAAVRVGESGCVDVGVGWQYPSRETTRPGLDGRLPFAVTCPVHGGPTPGARAVSSSARSRQRGLVLARYELQVGKV